MTDIVERLRAGWVSHKTAEEAADEIERLEAEIKRLQAHAKSMVDALNVDIDAKTAEIARLRTTVNDQAATITGLLREIDRLLPTPPIARHDTDTRP